MKDYLPNYFGSEWSFAQYKYKDIKEGITHCVFTLSGNVALINDKGVF